MAETRLTAHPDWTIDQVSPLLFGGFLEHMGRAVYQGVYDPASVHSDEAGIRTDVLQALRDLDMTIMRYPGGNFASGYHWQDGVGAKEGRPTVRELAWQSLESNQFGTDEFIALCRKAGWQPMLSANLGTGSAEEARNWVEYCNSPAGRWADLRIANGHSDPHEVVYWCLGNEMDGPWQLGHVPAEQYGVRAQQAAKMMRDCDRRVRTVACGSSSPDMATFLEWDRTVLEQLGGLADYVSLHRYVGNRNDVTEDYLAMGISIDAQIEAVDACTRYVSAKRRSRKRAYLCFDEWNVWYKVRQAEAMDGKGKHAPHLIEEVYNLEDALVVASFLMSFIRHADSVKIANIAQIVNVIAPILTRDDEMLLQSIYYAFQMVSRRKTGTALRVVQKGPELVSDEHGNHSEIDCAVILDDEKQQMHVFAMNRNIHQPADLTVELLGQPLELVSADLLHAGCKTHNTFEEPRLVVSTAFDDWSRGAEPQTQLPPHSFLASTFRLI